MSSSSYGALMQTLTAEEDIRRDYFDARTAEVGDRVRRPDDGDDAAWSDAVETLRQRDLCLLDDGYGYVIAWRWAADGSYLDHPIVGEQPDTSASSYEGYPNE